MLDHDPETGQFIEWDWQNMPTLGENFVYPEAVKACFRAYYEHHKANKPISEFTFRYELTREDLGC
jgi:hypothetical protein